MKKKIGLAILTALLASNNYAVKQTIRVCLNVENDTWQRFMASFVSSDYFDKPKGTSLIMSGNSCIEHTYNHGPKNIRMNIFAWENNNTEFRLDSSCTEVHLTSKAIAHTNFLRTSPKNVTWYYKISQTQPYVNIYTIFCYRY